MEEGVEIKFAQKLAGNEKEGRDKTLKKLKKWIQLKSKPESSGGAFTELELLKLWKGLFFCMWMSDKPLVQEQLAEELSRLVHVFPHRQDGVTFCSTFFTTMAREWHGIDVIRREKFMMLVRRVLRQALSLLLPVDDGDGGSLSRLTALCEAAFARPEDPARLPLGLQLHLVEVFLEEVAKVGKGRLTTEQMATLLAPFIQVLSVSRQSTLRSTVTDSVFYHLMRQSDVGIAHEAIANGEELGGDSDDDASGDDVRAPSDGEEVLDPRAGGVDVTLPQLEVDYGRLADDLTAAGAEPAVRQRNRAALYRLAQQFRDLSEGEYPLAVKMPDHIDSDSDISDEDMAAAVLRLQSTKQRLNKDSRKNQKNKKRLRPETEDQEPQPTKKKKKLKHKLLANGVIDTGDQLMAEAEDAPQEEHEDGEEEQPAQRPRTLKEKRRHKLRERREAEAVKQKKRKDKQEAKRAKLTGDTAEGGEGMVNGVVLNGDHDVREDEGSSVVEKESAAGGVRVELGNSCTSPAEVQESTPPATASKEKKKRAAKDDSVKIDSAPGSLDGSTSPKTKKKKKKASSKPVNSEAVNSAEPAVTEESPSETPSPAVTSPTENGTQSPPLQKKSKKKKKHQKQPATAADVAVTEAAPSADGPVPAPGSTFVWSLGNEDDWDDPAPAPVPAPAVPVVQKPAGKPAQKSAAAAAAQSPVAHFVPSRPVPAFVKLRTGKKGAKAAAQGSPATPRTPGGTKKVIINLSENKAQGFKEHLITVRNSPQVPHNPHLQPSKGLLKPCPAPTPAVRAAGRRSQAADFFSV